MGELHDIIERLRADALKLRTRKNDTAFRWLEDQRKWRWSRQVADDLNVALDHLTRLAKPGS